ncbi:MAG: isocitrate lyase/phosphoenolpyruvate mutase family protein [Pseudomonadota bacterium]
MTTQSDQAHAFHALHKKGEPVVLFNVWDPGSAKAVAKAGARAIATGSAPVAMAHGFVDGEQIPLDLALDNIRRIVAAVDLPVTADLEGGYGVAPEIVAETVSRALAAGAIGFNFEDQVVGGTGLHEIDVQAARVAAARAAAEDAGVPAYINARTDIFLKTKPETHDQAMLDQAIERAQAFAQSGASGFFAPALADEGLIGKLCEACPLPVNIIALPNVPPAETLASLGVARISYGPVPYRRMIQWLEEAAREALN